MPELSTLTSTALAQLPFTLLVISAVFALLTLSVMPKPHSGSSIMEVIFRSYLFWTLLALFLKDAAVLGAFGPDAAGYFGTPATPVPQAANASLAFALITLLALSGSLGLRLAAVIGTAVTLLAPFAGSPTTETVAAHLPEVAVVAVGLLLLLVQWGGGGVASSSTHGSAPATEPMPRPTTPEAAAA
jgi:hypothetical protein